MAKKRSKRRKTAANKKQEYPGWVWMLFGLAIGLSVAFAIYVRDRDSVAPPVASRQPASLESAIDRNDEAAAEKEPSGASTGEPAAETRESRFTFYDMLPNFEVVIPEQEPDVTADIEPRAVVQPGLYILQAGSFTRFEDADRRRAELALHGIESTIQRVTIDDKAYHRVRIGPTDDLEELNMLRSRLRAAKIDVIRIRLGE
jgi:cell division protein FtsN